MPEASLVLDSEFLFLVSLVRPVFAALSGPDAPGLREQARAWLERLCQVPAKVDSARRDRNEYLSRLYYGMMANKLDPVFMDEPPEGALKPPHEVFTNVDLETWLSDAASDAAPPSSQGRGDADERTYLATQVLPGGRGAFGYLAVSLAKGGPHWVSGDPGTSWREGDPQATSTPLAPDHPAGAAGPQPDASPMEGRLGARPPAEQRQQLLSFYDSLIHDLDQAVAEPDKTTPELEKLITSFQDPSDSLEEDTGVTPRQAELLSQLRERLEERRDRAAQRSLLLDSLEEDAAHGAPGPSAASRPRGPQRRAMDEDDVWNIRPENVTLLEAAYPKQLVHRFLDAIVRERVSVLGRVRARRHLQQRVEGLEDDAAEDMEHYKDATAAWAGVLRSSDAAAVSEEGKAAVESAAGQADRCSELASTTTDIIRELGAARTLYFENEERHRQQQIHAQAEIEVLRAEEAVLKRRLQEADRAGSGGGSAQ